MFNLFKNKKEKVINTNTKVIDYDTFDYGNYNKELFYKCLNSFIQEKLQIFLKNNPIPFNVGDLVTYDYYGFNRSNCHNFGWFSWFNSAQSNFKSCKKLQGSFTNKISKIRADTSFLYDMLEYVWSNELMYCTKKLYKTHIYNLLKERYDKKISMLTSNSFIVWIIDFDWEKIKLAYDGKNGWLNLRWGGFNAGEFLLTNTELGKQTIILSRKEQFYLKQIEKLNKQKENIKEKIDNIKNNINNNINNIYKL